MTIRAVPLPNGGAIARLCPDANYRQYCEDKRCDALNGSCYHVYPTAFAVVCFIPKDHPVMIAQAIARDSKLN